MTSGARVSAAQLRAPGIFGDRAAACVSVCWRSITFPRPMNCATLRRGCRPRSRPGSTLRLKIRRSCWRREASIARLPARRSSRLALGSFHDLLGALIWLHFPALKTSIHRAQLAVDPGRTWSERERRHPPRRVGGAGAQHRTDDFRGTLGARVARSVLGAACRVAADDSLFGIRPRLARCTARPAPALDGQGAVRTRQRRTARAR